MGGLHLLADLRLDLTRVAREEREEALASRVDHIHLVQAHCVHHLVGSRVSGFWFRVSGLGSGSLCASPGGGGPAIVSI